MSRKVLVISPHFDDEVIGCGGAIQRHLAAGQTVGILYITRGDCGDIRQGLDKEQSAAVRHDEAAQVCSSIGATAFYLNAPNEGFMRPHVDVEQDLVKFLRQYRPTIVYCPHPEESHRDHQVVASLTTSACRNASLGVFPHLGTPKHLIEEIRYYEVWTPMRHFNLAVDITAYLDEKSRSINLYKSQTSSIDYAEAVKGLNRYRGLMTLGGGYAEVFDAERVRPIRVGSEDPI